MSHVAQMWHRGCCRADWGRKEVRRHGSGGCISRGNRRGCRNGWNSPHRFRMLVIGCCVNFQVIQSVIQCPFALLLLLLLWLLRVLDRCMCITLRMAVIYG